jgi:hypothetical protein
LLKNLLDDLGFESVKDFQASEQNLFVDGLFGPASFTSLYNKILQPILLTGFRAFFRLKNDKRQIVWHHTAGRDDVMGVFNHWNKPGKHISTPVVITRDGELNKLYSEEFWGHALGISSRVFREHGIRRRSVRFAGKNYNWGNNILLNQSAVQAEITNFGHLKNGKSWFGEEPRDKIELGFRGYGEYHEYSEEQLKTLMKWTLLMSLYFDIPVEYDHDCFWNVNKDALEGKPGLYTHCSFRPDKTDVSPQPNLIQMATKLEEWQM